MWKNALSAAAAMVCIAGPAIAAEGPRLSVPANLQQAHTEAAAPSEGATLRPARIMVVEGDESTPSPAKSPAARPSPALHKPRQIKTTGPKPVVVDRTAEKKSERKAASSSRRTASGKSVAESEAGSEGRIKFRPVEVKPLREDPRRVASSAPTAPMGEVQYPVMPADSLAGELTAEYEEDDTTIATTEPGENFAPIVSAADLPRPGVRPTGGSEAPASPDLNLPPVQPQAAAPEVRQNKKPRTLASVLRFPEFRPRPAKRTGE
jgi:hypothetical protein